MCSEADCHRGGTSGSIADQEGHSDGQGESSSQ